MTNGIPPIEERLAMKRIPWRSFSNAELEEVGAAAYLRGNIKLLTAVRREVRKRSLDDRPWADGSTQADRKRMHDNFLLDAKLKAGGFLAEPS